MVEHKKNGRICRFTLDFDITFISWLTVSGLSESTNAVQELWCREIHSNNSLNYGLFLMQCYNTTLRERKLSKQVLYIYNSIVQYSSKVFENLTKASLIWLKIKTAIFWNNILLKKKHILFGITCMWVNDGRVCSKSEGNNTNIFHSVFICIIIHLVWRESIFHIYIYVLLFHLRYDWNKVKYGSFAANNSHRLICCELRRHLCLRYKATAAY